MEPMARWVRAVLATNHTIRHNVVPDQCITCKKLIFFVVSLCNITVCVTLHVQQQFEGVCQSQK